MANLDFSEILSDPDLASKFDVIRRAETVGNNGRTVIAPVATYEKQLGIVVAGDPDNLLRKEEGQMTMHVITVTTKFRLRASSEGVQPDIIVYKGSQFTVKALKPWVMLGSGFVVAVAESEKAFDSPP